MGGGPWEGRFQKGDLSLDPLPGEEENLRQGGVWAALPPSP